MVQELHQALQVQAFPVVVVEAVAVVLRLVVLLVVQVVAVLVEIKTQQELLELLT